MGLRETLQKVAVTAVKAVGNVAVPIDYLVPGTKRPDTATGVMKSSESAIPLTCPFDQVNADDLARYGGAEKGKIMATDMKALIPSLTLGAIIPSTDHALVVSGVRYVVIRYAVDPANALYTVYVRS